MLFDTLRRIAAHLFRPTNAAPASDTLAQRASALEFDPMWHGDHWQNLLSSPMDARHYVIEDWSLTPGLEFAPAVADGKHQ
ncbi:hypothetical protein ACFQ3P_30315 [Paraburkholderia sabiae]|jgi:hypothetical protein|uniref:Uncharacterized protein n=1 Tax=Paraburkholderia sabiae TaxID=273251 RepID=A0ABU9QN91_9BURK|nr:hypothetical protein [Paraburkholderia sabiae]WJZ74929.1 hypothetical protein QEN71_03695 [Paraburkholderia sabiae]CAD6551554.1 hypothetical protein LMG24235_04951 [Paraburkholderia sabiae]